MLDSGPAGELACNRCIPGTTRQAGGSDDVSPLGYLTVPPPTLSRLVCNGLPFVTSRPDMIDPADVIGTHYS